MIHRFIDGHNDTLLMLEDGVDKFFKGIPNGHLDYSKGMAAGFAAGFFAVFCPNPDTDPAQVTYKTEQGYEKSFPASLDPDYAWKIANTLISRFYQLEACSEGRFKAVRTVEDLDKAWNGEWMGGILHMEGAEPIDEGLDALHVYYHAGLRSLGPVWARKNIFGEGVPYRFPSSPDTGPGITEAGRRLVKVCNALGVMIDLSHINEKGFWDIATLTDAPLVATHSNAHAICPISRNLTDRQLDAVKDSGGLVGVTYSTSPNMVTEDGVNRQDVALSAIVKHIHYMIERMGIDHVALGSDFDGTRIPYSMHDVTGVPKILRILEKEGMTEGEIYKITQGNWRRVLSNTWK
ncbi:peptidase [Bacillus sp. SB49]|uniref:dipeptidase n=1 Tax=Bacillaceae TaxID=186817 RepID=UPI0002A4D4DB|nr:MULTISPECIES: dipeptidase [Bacillaceae]ELK44452.1 membrane dipeptidase [Halobacillus sp. BAB-2008]QHT46942.1 peptidase [Bacillus sp. SB49]